MITELERKALIAAILNTNTGDTEPIIQRTVQYANTGKLSVQQLLFLIEVRPDYPLQIWDMDGTLADTEPTAFAACALVMNLFGKRKGLDLNFTGATLLKEYVGRSFTGMVQELQKKHHFEVTADELKYYAALEKRMVMRRFRVCGITPTEGSKELIEASFAVGYKLSIASSSALQRISLCVKLLGLTEYFGANCLFSGTDMGASKPKPDVYLKAAAVMGVAPAHCISFEDEVPGAESANKAGIGMRMAITLLTPEAKRAAHAQRMLGAGVNGVATDFGQMPALMLKLARSA